MGRNDNRLNRVRITHHLGAVGRPRDNFSDYMESKARWRYPVETIEQVMAAQAKYRAGLTKALVHKLGLPEPVARAIRKTGYSTYREAEKVIKAAELAAESKANSPRALHERFGINPDFVRRLWAGRHRAERRTWRTR